MSSMHARSMYHAHKTILITGFPDDAPIAHAPEVTVVAPPAEIYPLAEESDPFPSDPFPTDPNAFEEPASTLSIVPSKERWFCRQQDGVMFKAIRSSRGRVELQSACATYFDTAILHDMFGWRSVSPTNTSTYRRVPEIK